MAIFCILCHPPFIAFLQSHLIYLPRVTYNTIVSKKPLSWLSFQNYHCVLILFLIVYYPVVHWLSFSISYMFTCLLYLGFESLNFIILQYCSAPEEIGHICWSILVLLCNGEQLWEAYLILYSVYQCILYNNDVWFFFRRSFEWHSPHYIPWGRVSVLYITVFQKLSTCYMVGLKKIAYFRELLFYIDSNTIDETHLRNSLPLT